MLIKGKRYEWPVQSPFDGRMKNGLFTGEYAKNGNALFMTKRGEVWSVPEQDCSLKKKIRRGCASAHF